LILKNKITDKSTSFKMNIGIPHLPNIERYYQNGLNKSPENETALRCSVNCQQNVVKYFFLYTVHNILLGPLDNILWKTNRSPVLSKSSLAADT
jgi:hypothetical protein